jgi:hypothetical protein
MELTWNVISLECATNHEGQTNVVTTAHWTLEGVDGEHTGSSYGSVGIAYNSEGSFTEFDSLTKEQVISWVKEILGEDQVTEYETSVTNQIEAKKTPTTITPTLPWAVTAE